MISNSNPLKKSKNDEENAELVPDPENEGFQPPSPGFIVRCMQSNSYCLSLMDYLKKLLYFSQIDFHSAYVQLLYCFKPQEINEVARVRKHLKNQWARDDPGFVLVILLNIILTSVAYCLAFNSMDRLFSVVFKQFFLYFLVFGLAISFVLRYLIETYYKNEDLTMNKIQNIEYFYAFDIHSNSFVPFYFCVSTVQFILLPILVNDGKASLVLGNTLYATGSLFYLMVTTSGYFSLPYIKRTSTVSKIIWLVVIFFVIITLMKVNIARWFISSYTQQLN
mmetsp:Transcript_5161/g.5298  ORF Transcript_5161/g.5298 Transcript_5161/m.5298 type:complete len:279 (-) Transcript_5161:28-864(-)